MAFMHILNYFGISDVDSSSSEDSIDFFNDSRDFFTSGRMDSEKTNSPPLLDQEKDKPREMLKLTDLAARATALYYPCDVLEGHQPPLDETMLKKVAYWAFPQDEKKVKIYARLSLKCEDDWRRGENLYKDQRIEEIRQVGFMISAIIMSRQISTVTKEDSKVSITFERQMITSTKCAICPQVMWCPHIVAVIIHRIRRGDEVPLHAPVTETLSSLTRDQLQKLLQYAINADPGGILGRVFQNIDAIRDSSSDLSTLQGAPDPTFGVGCEEATVWELSIEQVKKNLKEDFKTGYRSWPDTSNIVDKLRSGFYDQYLQSVVDLINKKEYTSAGKVLINIADSAMDAKVNQMVPSERVSRLFMDIERFFCCFIVSYPGIARSELIEAAIHINKTLSIEAVHTNWRKPNEWSDLSSIRLDHCDNSAENAGTLGVVPDIPYFQPICSSFIKEPPPSLHDLYSGKDAVITSNYEEPLPVMLLRFDCMILFESSEVLQNLCKLGLVILRKLLNKSTSMSVIGHAMSKDNVETKEDGPSKPKRARLHRKKRKSSLPPTKPTQEDLQEEIEGLTKPQIAYSLMYVCYTLYRSKEFTGSDDEAETSLLMEATLRAVELSRYKCRATQGSLTYKDYTWLLHLEGEVLACYLKLAETLGDRCHASQLYTSVLVECGFGFYQNNIAIALLNLLLKQNQMGSEACIQLCTDAVMNTPSPLENLTAPPVYIGYGYGNEHYDMAKKWSNVIDRLFNRLSENGSIVDTELVTKLLRHFTGVQDRKYLFVAYNVLRGYQTYLVDKGHILLMLRIVLRCVSLYANKQETGSQFSINSSYDTLTLLGSKMENQVFPTYILPEWQNLCKCYSPSQLSLIIEIMKESIVKQGSMSQPVKEYLLKYFGSSNRHDEESCKLFLLFESNCKGQSQALQKILSNSQQYTPRSLLGIAKTLDESSSKRHNLFFSKDVGKLVQLAMERIYELKLKTAFSTFIWSEPSTTVYLKWFFEKIAENGCEKVASDKQFIAFMDSLCKCMWDDADILVQFIEAMRNSQPMFEAAKKVICPMLLSAFQTQFHNDLKNCNHTSYPRILSELSKAKATFVQLVDDGDAQFKTEVVKYIRAKHKGKKKLIKMMDDYHTDLSVTDL